jgi:Ca2+:H+ antiporter
MASTTKRLPIWTIAAPLCGWLLLAGKGAGLGSGYYSALLAAGLFAGVLAAVHHAEVVAHRIGEPFGTLVLAAAITAIEVALIVTLMISGGIATAALARDTIFATVMIILNGIVGLCLLVGGRRYGEQRFNQPGVNAALSTLAAIVALTLILPNFTATPGPFYTPRQLAFAALASVVLYGAFVFVQTVRHRDYFLPENEESGANAHASPPPARTALASLVCLVGGLAAVVLLAKSISPQIEAAVAAAGAPPALVGVIIAIIVLLPEGLAALRAARANRLQTSLNLALGSALASIGLSIPAVAVVSIVRHWPLALGIDAMSTVLLVLSLLVATLSLGTGRTTILQGVVHLVLFATYLFLTVVP